MEPKDILVFIEQRDGAVCKVAYELLGEARKLSLSYPCKVIGCLLGYQNKKAIQSLSEYDFDELISVDHPSLKHYLTLPYANAFYEVVKHVNPNVILMGATSIGRDLAPRMSARLKTGLTADCTKLELDENGLLSSTRPAFGGNLFATIICPDHKPQMSTVRPGVMAKANKANKQVKVTDFKVDLENGPVEVIEEVLEKTNAKNIEEEKVLVGCGRGVGSDVNLQCAKDIAVLLKGTHCCSRALVDAKRVEQPRQVGQTGKTVKPDLYLAFGISGAVQHLAGMENSDYIIAINRDNTASIFNVASLGIVGDVNEILPKLKNRLIEETK